MPAKLKKIETFEIPLRPYNIIGIENVRALLKEDHIKVSNDTLNMTSIPKLKSVIEDLYNSNKKVIFTMGKGGVGNTTNDILKSKASDEIQWINKVDEISSGNFAVIEWKADEVKGGKLTELIEWLVVLNCY